MKSVFLVICNCGDGSQSIEWHKTMSAEKFSKMEDLDWYQSGEGVQVTELKFPDDFDLETFVKQNHIYWFDDQELF